VLACVSPTFRVAERKGTGLAIVRLHPSHQ